MVLFDESIDMVSNEFYGKLEWEKGRCDGNGGHGQKKLMLLFVVASAFISRSLKKISHSCQTNCRFFSFKIIIEKMSDFSCIISFPFQFWTCIHGLLL